MDRNSHEWHEYLRELFRTHLVHLEDHWKAAVEAVVPTDMADDMADAMNFMGALVDAEFEAPGGNVRLVSDGYWAHGF
jgi:hypothetical protein